MRSRFLTSRFPYAAFVLLALVFAVGACASGPEAEPEANGAKEAGADEPEENLLSDADRSQLYFDLDQYTSRYMAARDEGNSRAWMSLHASVLMPMVERNLRELLTTAKSAEENRYRVIAVRALGYGSDLSGPRISPVLVAQLGEEDVNLVNSALVSLYLLGWPETPIEPIVKELNHQDELIRSSGALALSRIVRRARQKAGDDWEMTPALREASGRLMEMAHRPEEDVFVRAHAAAALGAIGDPASADILINLLMDEHMVVRIRAAQALAGVSQESAIQPLIKALGVTESRAEAKIVVATLEKIALSLGHPMDKEALGLDQENWNAWYEAVKAGK